MLAPLGEAAIARLHPDPGEHVLDIGCGTGTTSVELARLVGRGGHVTGVDVSAPMLDEARRLARRPTRAPRELTKAMKQTIHDMGGITDSAAAVAREVDPQAWSMAQPEFKERVGALKESISKTS